MSETINKGWIEDESGNKFAPKTLTDQVQTGDGVKILDYIEGKFGNVDNTSDIDKPISTATQKALDNKASSDHNHDTRYGNLITTQTFSLNGTDGSVTADVSKSGYTPIGITQIKPTTNKVGTIKEFYLDSNTLTVSYSDTTTIALTVTVLYIKSL